MRRMILPSRALINRAHSLASAADVTTMLSTPQLTYMVPLMNIGSLSLGIALLLIAKEEVSVNAAADL